ncbi:tetratricopeptide repeat protein [Marinobacter zhejiangensis]|uniref:Putative PEP-CTERM system TPR-repeat lipoprotein n=1 Tax=Marinobacter zhejiangensis TaxID=488535 RepID=A0A1I4RPB7_9GAMM|nr:tetratricopeptide repeat protein [Marinobacter zhejiangensis]SFM54092.1 putative PEP-CTERM system TPR-repeat lipoprotein [Marinobacter zhejiangensis]
MKLSPLFRATLLSAAITTALVGCGEDERGMSQEDIQYISHLDQSRFFQRQGELKASTLEARSAIELQPGKVDPYFVIITNLVTAGDAVNAERQLNHLMSQLPDTDLTPEIRNRAALIFAETHLMQGQFDQALESLDSLESPDRAQELKAALLRGKIYLANARLGDSETAYNQAKELDGSSALPLVGLSRVAFARNNPAAVEDLISQAESIDPQEPELWLWKAQYAQTKGDWPASEEAYIKALEDIGQYDVMTFRKYETISALIRVLREQGKIAEAFVYEEILAKSAPGTIKSNMAAAREAFGNGDLDGAARYLEEILAQSPSHEQSALLLGMVRFRQGRVEEAESLLAPFAGEGESTEVNKLLAATKLEMRDPEGAREILENLEGAQSDPDVLALVGIASLASGDVVTGEGLIEKSLELNPDNDSLRLRYATYLAQKGQSSQALQLARQTMERSPDLDQARLLMIRIYMESGDQTSAKESANAWVKEQPENITALLTRGQIAAATGDEDEARRYFNQAQQTDTQAPSPLIALGNLARSQNDTEAAKRYFSEAAILAPNDRQALQGVTSVLARDEMLELMHKILETKPDAVGPRLVLLEAALMEGEDSEADEYTANLLEREDENLPSPQAPMVAAIYNGVASRLAQENKSDQAQQVLNRGRILFPENQDIALQAAVLAFSQGSISQAQDILQETKRLHPDSPRPFITEANYQSSQGDHKAAAELYQLALQKVDEPSTAIAYSRSLKRAGMTEKAISTLEEATNRHQNNAAIMLSLAMLYQESDRGTQAEQAYEKVLQIAPDSVLALNNLAWMYHENGDSRAMELAQRAYELNPDNAAIADTYGWIMLKAGRHEASVPVLEKAHQLQPDSEEIARHLAEAYRSVGMESEAQQILEKLDGQG